MTKTPNENLPFPEHLARRYGPEEAARMMASEGCDENRPACFMGLPENGVGDVPASCGYPDARKASGGKFSGVSENG